MTETSFLAILTFGLHISAQLFFIGRALLRRRQLWNNTVAMFGPVL